MVTDTDRVRESLAHVVVNIEKWRAEAARLRAERAASGDVSDQRLVEIETTAGDIYREIETFKEAVSEIGKQSPVAAGELAEVRETLQLLLLEITEMGTRSYSTRSGVDDTPAVE